MERRHFLASAAAGAAAAGAGCLGGGPGDGGESGETLANHPAGADLANQPRRGPADADATIVAFEDPSCPACRRFEQQTFPDLAEDAEAGKLAFYFRGIPIIYPWGEPASKALEATYAADDEAFWALKDHYYGEQASYPGRAQLSGAVRDDVYRRTEEFLASSTDVDAATVVEAARASDHDAAVQSDLDASRRVGVSGTPTFTLFRDGSFVTTVVGPQGYSVFANALGL
jgi:protein-disulfide isomerase